MHNAPAVSRAARRWWSRFGLSLSLGYCEALEPRTLLSAGDLDPTFGTGGKVLLPDSAGSLHYTIATDVVQGDGKVILAGGATGTAAPQLFLERLNPDGSPDLSFGNHGIVIGATGPANSIALQANNQIVVGGSGFLARFNANGSPDNSFGTGGVAPALTALQSIAVAPDGKILDAGETADHRFIAERHNAGGSLDLGFNGIGSVSRPTDAAPNFTYSFATIGVQGDGKVLVGSALQLGLGVWRFNTDGSTDTSFGEGGVAWAPLPYVAYFIGYNWGAVSKLIVQSDGRILVAGPENVLDETSTDWAISRFEPNGALDTSFGNNGLVEASSGPGFPDVPDFPGGLVLQPDGKIVVGGVHVVGNSPPYNGRGPFMAERLLPDGAVDPSFHSYDIGVFGPHDLGQVGATVLEPDGSILIAGNVADGTNIFANPSQQLPSALAVVRLQGDSPATPIATAYLGHPFNARTDTIEAENFDVGADGVAYHDSTTLNIPGQYRDTGVDIATGAGASNGFYVTDTTTGEWLRYRTYAPVTGNYTFSARVANSQAGAAFHVEIDGVNVHGSMAVPNTGSSQSWQTITSQPIHLLAGPHSLRVVMDAAAQDGSAGNFDRFNFTLAAPLPVAPGLLDPTFGDDGRTLVDDPDPNSDVQHRVKAVAVQSDGKILLAGSTGTRANNGVGTFFLERLNADGSIDTSFGTNGFVQTAIGPVSFATSILLLPDGRILVGGATENSATNITNASFALALYRADGTLESSFGNHGTVVTDFAGNEEVDSLALDAGGNIVADGAYFLYPNVGFDIARYKLNGSLDSSFNGTGMLSFGLGQTGAVSAAVGLAIGHDGSIIVAAHNGNEPALFAFTPSGGIDRSFGASGVATIQIEPPGGTFRSVLVQPDGKIVAGAQVGRGFPDATPIARFNPDGSLDPSFGVGGVTKGSAATGMTDGYLLGALLLQSDGKVLVVANQENEDAAVDGVQPPVPHFLVERYLANGQLDSGFRAATQPGFLPPPPWSNELAEGAALGPDGNLAVAGDVFPFPPSPALEQSLHWIGVARYVTQNAWLPGDTNQDGRVDFADLLALGQNFGSQNADWSTGDFNGDGDVSFADLLLLAQNYGKTLQAAGSVAAALVKPAHRLR